MSRSRTTLRKIEKSPVETRVWREWLKVPTRHQALSQELDDFRYQEEPLNWASGMLRWTWTSHFVHVLISLFLSRLIHTVNLFTGLLTNAQGLVFGLFNFRLHFLKSSLWLSSSFLDTAGELAFHFCKQTNLEQILQLHYGLEVEPNVLDLFWTSKFYSYTIKSLSTLAVLW